MRDLLIFLMVFGSLPMIMMRPWFGIIVWCWLGFMNPHRLTWGFAYDFQFAMLVAAVTLMSVPFSKEPKQFDFNFHTLTWIALIFWMIVTTIFALDHDTVGNDFSRTMKIQLFSFLTVVLINDREKLRWLLWVTVASLGFFGIKGGLFAIRTGGNNLVWGPPGSFIAGNNELGLALVMTLPLMYFLYTQAVDRRIRWGLVAAMGLSALAVLTTHSRGAFLALGAMAVYLWLKSDKKLIVGIVLLIAAPVMLGFMPDAWVERMHTIKDYEQDGSAMGRINAWWFAYNLALDHPFTGGGFGTFVPELFKMYAPDPEDFHDAHSIYFEVLGEHGFVGLGLFLALGLITLLRAGSIVRQCKRVPELAWAAGLMRMLQVSLVGYAVNGLFLGLAYFNLYYHLVAIVVITGMIVNRELAVLQPDTRRVRRPLPGAAPVVAHKVQPAPEAPKPTGMVRPRPGDRFQSGRRAS